MESLKELNERKAKCWNDAKALNDREQAGETLSPEDVAIYERLMAEFDAAEAEVEKRFEAAQAAKSRADALSHRKDLLGREPIRQIAPLNLGSTAGTDGARSPLPEHLQKMLLNNEQLAEIVVSSPRMAKDYRSSFTRALSGDPRAYESLALRADNDASGGYLIAPEQFVMELIASVDDAVVTRGLARKFMVPNAKSLGAPRRATKASTFVWGTELQEPTADTSLTFGKRALYPHFLMGEISVSRDLLNSALMGVDAIVRGELARDSGEVQEAAFMEGTGANQPLGLFTASNDGISTGRDVTTGLTTGITSDSLIDALYTLKTQYQQKATWLFHRDAVKLIRKLKTGDGAYLWEPSFQEGQASRLLGRTVKQSEFVPHALTSQTYCGIVGDFDWYWIVDSLDLEIEADMSLSRRSYQTVYIARQKLDAMPVLEEAFVRIKTS